MHPYRDMPVDSTVDAGDRDTQLAFVVLASVGMIEMFVAPLTPAGAFGAACSIASIVWLARYPAGTSGVGSRSR